jgi:anti-sigma factor RsiW
MLGELSDYLDGDLGPELCRQLEAHLASCPNCRIMLDSLTKTVRLFREGQEEPLPEELKSSLRNALRGRLRKKRRSDRHPKP